MISHFLAHMFIICHLMFSVERRKPESRDKHDHITPLPYLDFFGKIIELNFCGSLWAGKDQMDQELVKKAKLRVPSIPILVNMVSKRVKQLNTGMRPLVMPLSPDEDKLDIALREIAEGKLIAENDFEAVERDEAAHAKWSY